MSLHKYECAKEDCEENMREEGEVKRGVRRENAPSPLVMTSITQPTSLLGEVTSQVSLLVHMVITTHWYQSGC
jgi:hypothetical protein